MTYEWSVFATDCVLAIACAFSVSYIRRRVPSRVHPAWYFLAALATCGITAAVGGFRHGLAPILPPRVYHALWIISYLGIIFAGSLLFLGVIQGTMRHEEQRRAYRALCTSKFATFATFFLIGEETWLVGLSWGFDVLLIAGVGALLARSEMLGRYLLAGAVVSVFAGLVQQGLLVGTAGTLHDNLFHLLMVPAVFLYARASLLLREFDPPKEG